MEMLFEVFGVVVGVIVVLLIVVAMQPSSFRVSRSTTINAPPSTVFPHVNEFRKWRAWSPWEKMDPSMTQTYDGPAAGVGSTTHWIGNKQVGEGRMTIIESKPSELVRIRLEFIKPFTATNTAEFTFTPRGGQTAVEWAMTGEKNFIFKAFGLFMSMDKMVGKDFEKGLAAMKVEAEKS